MIIPWINSAVTGLSQESVKFSRLTVVVNFRKRKVKIHKVKVRPAYDLRSMVRKEPAKDRRLRRVAEKEVRKENCGIQPLEKWEG